MFGTGKAAWVLLSGTLAMLRCDSLSSREGEHVVYHWDEHDFELCGGTVPYLDALVEVYVDRYSLPARMGGKIEYYRFSDQEQVDRFCVEAPACASVSSPLLTLGQGTSAVYTTRSVHPHEVAHAVVDFRLGRMPPLLSEGMAGTLESNLLDETPQVYMEPRPQVFEDELWALAESWSYGPTEYLIARKTWAALELKYGVPRMKLLAERIGSQGGAAHFERALIQEFGLSFSDVASLVSDAPWVYYDDPACDMVDLPVLSANSESLALPLGDSRRSCDDVDVINSYTDEVQLTSMFVWLAKIRVTPSQVNTIVSSIEQASESIADAKIMPCLGSPSDELRVEFYVWGGEQVLSLQGDYVIAIYGVELADGSVRFPRLSLSLD